MHFKLSLTMNGIDIIYIFFFAFLYKYGTRLSYLNQCSAMPKLWLISLYLSMKYRQTCILA